MADTSVTVTPGQAPSAPAPAPAAAPAGAPASSSNSNSVTLGAVSHNPTQHTFTLGGPEQPQQAAPQGDRPAWLPQKFQSPEQMALAYANLEQMLGQRGAQQQAPQSAQFGQGGTQTGQPAATGAFDFDLLRADMSQGGQISEATYRAHEAKGVDRASLRAFVEGQRALATQRASAVHEAVGGKQAYEQMQAWAAANLTADEKIAYTQAVNSSPEAAKLAAQGLLMRFRATGGQPGQLIQGGVPGATSDGFRSIHEMTQAMRDPRYKKDPAFRQDVTRKIASMR